MHYMETNRITEIYSSIPDDELILAVNEIKQQEIDGNFPENSIVRHYAREFSKIIGMPPDIHIGMVAILKEASFRWANLK